MSATRTNDEIKISDREARQARVEKPVFKILIVSLVLAAIAAFGLYAYFNL